MKRAVRENFDLSVEDYVAYEADTGRFAVLARQLRDVMVERGATLDLFLDAGAGTGASTTVFAEAGDVVALDASRGMLAANPATRRVLGDLERLPFPDATFDAVAFTASLFVVPDPGRAAREARRVLRAGGVVGATAPAGWFVDGADAFAGRARTPGAPEALDDVRAGLERDFAVEEGDWSLKVGAADVRSFFTIPAIAASLYPKLPPARRRERALSLLDDLDGPVEHRWRWFVGR